MKRFPIVLSTELGVGQVQLCSKQCIHLSVGPVTLNLSPMAFAETAELVRSAMQELSKLIELDEITDGSPKSAEPARAVN